MTGNYKIIDETNKACFVCVAMLTYNHEDYISMAIDSILQQRITYPFKIIISDDFSTDKTRSILLQYQKKHPEIFKVLFQDSNVGPKQNNIDLLRHVEGKYVAALEGDDYWIDQYKLQKQIDFLEENQQYSFCWTRFKTLNQNTGELQEDLNAKYFSNSTQQIDFDYELFYKGWHIGVQTLVFRNEGFDLERCMHFNNFKDVHVINDLLKSGKGVCLNFVSAVYRVHSKGIHASIDTFNGYRIGYETHKEIYFDNTLNPYLKKKYVHSFKNFINANIVVGNFRKAFLMSFKLFLVNWSIIDLLKHIKRIFKAIV